MKESWQTLSEEEIDKNRFWSHMRRQFRRPDGKEGTYDLVEKNHAALVVARGDDGRFLMIREYRYLIDDVGIAVTAGGIEPGEEPIDGAVREFREETGCEAARAAVLQNKINEQQPCGRERDVETATLAPRRRKTAREKRAIIQQYNERRGRHDFFGRHADEAGRNGNDEPASRVAIGLSAGPREGIKGE
ncbi:MAG: NUDIX domain-containing protein [Opitutaceae bacterium]|nr:NUDIX domain-containing protein [Opitutaceae bacterium]